MLTRVRTFGLVSHFDAEVGEDCSLGLRDFGWEGLTGAVDGDGRRAQRSQLLDDVGDGQPTAFLDAVRDGQGGEHDGQMRLDRVAGAVEHRPGLEVGLGHPKRALDVPKVVVFRDHLDGRHHRDVEVGDVTFQPDQRLRTSQADFIENAVSGVGLDEPGGLGGASPLITARARASWA